MQIKVALEEHFSESQRGRAREAPKWEILVSTQMHFPVQTSLRLSLVIHLALGCQCFAKNFVCVCVCSKKMKQHFRSSKGSGR